MLHTPNLCMHTPNLCMQDSKSFWTLELFFRSLAQALETLQLLFRSLNFYILLCRNFGEMSAVVFVRFGKYFLSLNICCAFVQQQCQRSLPSPHLKLYLILKCMADCVSAIRFCGGILRGGLWGSAMGFCRDAFWCRAFRMDFSISAAFLRDHFLS